MLVISVVLNANGKIVAGPTVKAVGLPGDDEYSVEEAVYDLGEDAAQALKRIPAEERGLDETVETALNRAVKKAAHRIWERRPVVETTVLRI
jgi:ribonuclease J